MLNKNKIIQLQEVWVKVRAGCIFYKSSFLVSIIKCIVLYVFKEFSAKEIVGYGLYLPKVRNRIPVLISKQRSLQKLELINSKKYEARVEDKDKFYEICRANNLPIPRAYGVFHAGRLEDVKGNKYVGNSECASYFESEFTGSFILKDVSGVYGSGFSAFERQGNNFVGLKGEILDSGQLYDQLSLFSTKPVILQEQLYNHPLLVECIGDSALSTLRLTTYLNGNGDVSLLFYILKIAVGASITDNFAMGTTGNIIAFGDHGRGILSGGLVSHPSGSGLLKIDSHPETKVKLEGFKIPMWNDAVRLAKTSHKVFEEFGALGWDIALTEEGPIILETNPWWDPPTYAPQVMSDKNWQLIFS